MEALLSASLAAGVITFATLCFASGGRWGRLRQQLRNNAWQFAGLAVALQVVIFAEYQQDKRDAHASALSAIGRAAMDASLQTQTAILGSLRSIQEDVIRPRAPAAEGLVCTRVREELDVKADQRILGRSTLYLQPEDSMDTRAFMVMRFQYGRTRYQRKPDGYSIDTAEPEVFVVGSDGRKVEILEQTNMHVNRDDGYFTLNRYMMSESDNEGYAVTTVTTYLGRRIFGNSSDTVQLSINYSVEGWCKEVPASFVYVNPREYGTEGVDSYEATIRFESPLMDDNVVILAVGGDGALQVVDKPTDPTVSVHVADDCRELDILARQGMNSVLAVFYRQRIEQSPRGIADYGKMLSKD